MRLPHILTKDEINNLMVETHGLPPTHDIVRLLYTLKEFQLKYQMCHDQYQKDFIQFKETVEILRGTLSWYADARNYLISYYTLGLSEVQLEGGKKARHALQDILTKSKI